MTSVSVFLIAVALLMTLATAFNGKVPLWIAVFFVCVALLIGHVPGLK